MSFYDALKDAINLAQKADNIELYRQLLDLSAQALDLQSENAKLKEENAQLKKQKDYEKRIQRHLQPYLTLEGEEPTVFYCSVCWGSEKKLIQMRVNRETDLYSSSLYCIKCANRCRFDNK